MEIQTCTKYVHYALSCTLFVRDFRDKRLILVQTTVRMKYNHHIKILPELSLSTMLAASGLPDQKW